MGKDPNMAITREMIEAECLLIKTLAEVQQDDLNDGLFRAAYNMGIPANKHRPGSVSTGDRPKKRRSMDLGKSKQPERVLVSLSPPKPRKKKKRKRGFF